MAIVPEWSGVELRTDRGAARWSQADLAARLEVSERGIAKVEAAGSGHSLRPITQAMLDDLLHPPRKCGAPRWRCPESAQLCSARGSSALIRRQSDAFSCR